jgi:hypothetical protein
MRSCSVNGMKIRATMGRLGLALSLVLLAGYTGPLGAATTVLWYNGDLDGRTCGGLNGINTSDSDGRVYDDFIVPASETWEVTAVFSNNLMNFMPALAHWEIRQGVSAGVGGTIVASGDSPATVTPTGRICSSGYTEFRVEVTGLNVDLGPGQYWLVVAPIGAGFGLSFVSSTIGANAIGMPPGNNGNAFFDGAFFFASADQISGISLLDFSLGVEGIVVSKPANCPLGQGFWKTHPGVWPVSSLTLGRQTYTRSELLTILDAPIRGDASLILAHQLIAAKLNLANGSSLGPISTTIAAADRLLSGFTGKLPYRVTPSSSIGQAMVNDATVLDSYNNDELTPDCTPWKGKS